MGDIIINFLSTATSPFEYINLVFIYYSIDLKKSVIYSLPFFIKYLIGYCNFYYQLGYGLIFYIYIFRKQRAKKKKTKSFYGNSFLNWLITTSNWVKTQLFSRSFLALVKNNVYLYLEAINLKLVLNQNQNNTLTRLNKLRSVLFNQTLYVMWSPVFKRTSYINILSNLRRFFKKK